MDRRSEPIPRARAPHRECVHHPFERQAERTPDALAVVSGTVELTYRELEERANRLARALLRRGAGPEVRVGICVERSAELVVGLLGILKAGAAYVPLDPAYPRERISATLRDARAPLLVAQERFRPLLDGHRGAAVWLGADLEVAGESAERPPCRAGSRNAAYLIYTSGSTGRPKGVVIEHRSAAALLEWCGETWPAEACAGVLGSTSVCFDMSVFEVFHTLGVGGTLVMAENALALPRLPARERVTLVNTVPSAAAELLRSGGIPASVRVVNLGGEPLPNALAQGLYGLGHVDAVWNLYGPTEDTTYSTFHRVARGAETEPPVGRALPGTRIHLLDAGLDPVPDGEAGEVYLAGDGLTRGYLDRPELTAERFLPDALGSAPGARMYRVGDRGRFLPRGELEYLGRVDHQVKIRGFRVEPGEVESVLRTCSGVAEAVVVAREDGSGDRRLVAYVTGAEGAPAPAAPAMREHLRERLPGYMVPAAWVVLEKLPLLPNGKLDRGALPEPDPAAGAGYVAPRTATEERLAGIWAEVLGVERVGIRDSFFELGGHSLRATQVITRVRAALGVELPMAALFDAPTVAELAERVSAAEEPPELPPLAPVSRDRPLPLSLSQEAIWFFQKLAPGMQSYNFQAAIRFLGRLDAEALERTLTEMVRRHEIFRTTFPEVGGQPVQVVHPAAPVSLAGGDLRGLAPSEREEEVAREMREAFGAPFDLARLPLVRWRLLRLAEDEHLLLQVEHHFVHDGWSFGVFLRELAAIYPAFARGEPSPLPELPIQFADFAVWHREVMRGERARADLAYWKEKLTGADPTLDLPTDRPRPPAMSFRGSALRTRVPPRTVLAARAFTRRSGATLYMTLLAGFEALLHRYTGQEDFCVGGAVANRSWKETEPLIGMIVNTVAFRARLGGARSFRELAARVKDTTREGYAHKDVHFGQVVEAVQPERSLSRLPIYQVAFGSHDSPYPDFALPGLALEVTEALSNGSAKFELSVIVMPRAEMRPGAPEDEIEAVWEYATDLFEESTVERMVRHYHALLEAVLADPEAGFREVPLLEEAERRQVLEWGSGGAGDGADACLHEGFEAQARRTPGVPAVVHGGESLSYAELDARADALAGELRARGVGPEVPVGVCLERGTDALAALLAVLKAGGAYVPLDPAYPAERLAFMLADSGVRLVLSAEPASARLPDFGGEVLLLGRAVPRAPAPAPPRPPSPGNLAYVIYTSGSTGTPKGVMVTHGAAARLLQAAAEIFGARPGGRVLQTASLSFDASILEIFLALLGGATLHVADRDTVLSGDALGALLRERGIDVWMSSPPLLELLAEGDFPALRTVGTGGERCSGELAARWSRGRRLLNLYGPTEATIYATWHPCPPGGAGAPPIGRPVAGARAYVLDAALQPVPAGMPGELYVGGVGVSRGYLGRPELTAERFVPDAVSGVAGTRLYRTGDRVRWRADGELEFLGRMDEQVKVRGFRIEPGEVEAALLAHPGVRAAAVTVREDAPGRRMLTAYAVAEEGVTGAELREAAKRRLPEYMVPAAVVLLEALPLTPAGKVDRRALPAPAGAEEEAYVAPRTPVEEVLAGIFEEVLGRERAGAHDDFFELGGHSLLATRVVARIRPALGVEVPVRALFEAPTVARLAARIEAERHEGEGTALPPLVRAERSRPLPLSFAQQRLWFIHQMEPDEVGYNMAFPTRLAGRLDPGALERALGALVERHESLRTVFRPAAGGAVQVVQPAGAGRLPLLDLGGLAPEARLPAALRLGEEDARRPFDLERGPVLRAALVRLSGEEHVLLLNMHHIVSDGWSMGVLFRDLYALYGAFASGTAQPASPLPPLPVQYPDFAVWQRGWLAGDTLRRQLEWWRERLGGSPPLLELPTDRPRPAAVGDRGASVRFGLPAETTHGLRSLARREGATLYMVARAAADLLLSRWSGQEDLVVGSPIANRTRVELDGLVGFFVNTLALRTDLSGDPAFRGLVGRVRETALGAYAHQDLPFERLVEEIAPERSLSRTPLFQVMFALQNARGIAAPPPPGLRAEPLALGTRAALFDLELELWDEGEALSGRARFRTDLFDPATVERLCAQYRTLLAAVCVSPGELLSRLPILPAEEAQAVLAYGSGPLRESTGDAPAHRLFAAQAARTPDAPAVLFEGEALTYAELDALADRLARHLRRRGVGTGTPVAVCVERGPRVHAALLAVWKAGGVYLPLDPTHPAERLSFLLRDSGAELVVTESPLAGSLPEHGPATVLLDRLAEGDRDGSAEPVVEPSGAPDDLAYLVYTSGSTGTPKAVMVEHAQLTHTLRGSLDALGFRAGDVVAALASVAFDISLLELVAPLLAGAAVRVVPRDVARDPEALVDAAGDVTVLHAVPALARQVVDAARGGRSLPELRLLLVGGDTVPPDLLEDVRAVFPGARTRVLYGPTEAAIICAAYAVPAEGEIVGHPLGRPLPGVRLRVHGPRGEILPVGVPGEVWISGGGVARGYLGRPELTGEKFVTAGGARAYRTGDRARWRPDGVLEFLGRTDEQVKVRGFRIEPGEVEAVLREQPGVREAVVLAREDRPGERRLVAYVVPHSAAGLPADPGTATEQVVGWEAVFDEAYGEGSSAGDPTLNLTGWNSSYTGEPIPREEMREWVERTVERIRALGPERVLEIGCGTGLLLFRVAPHTRAYRATDFSGVALDFVRRHLAGLPQVTLSRRGADDDLAEHAGAGYDTVVLNSVAQYFPGVDYLLRVLEGAAAALRPGGRIFVGDVRSLPLLGAFHASVELAHAPDELPVERLRERVRRGMAEEQELVVEPALFEALRARIPRVGRVEVEVKRGGYDNEVSCFRYDVVLHLDVDPAGAAEPVVRTWSGEDVAALRALAEQTATGLLVRGVPDARVGRHVRALELISAGDGAGTAERVRALAAAEPAGGIAPEALFALAGDMGRAVEVRPGPAGSLDALFHPVGGVCAFPAEEGEERPWEAYANDPQWGRRMRALVPALRAAARARLPEHMVPSAFVVLEALPVTPNGKVDRAALPVPDAAGPREGIPPRTESEARMAGIWAEVLGVERVGVEESFFELGGHSLLATRVISRAREAFGVDLPLRALFEAPTVAELSRRVEVLRGRPAPGAGLPPLVPVPRERALPLSFAQQRLWFIHRLDPGSSAYNLPLALRLRGAVCVRALERTLGEVVRRHEALRTTFAEAGGEPMQVVHPPTSVPLPVTDLSRLPEEARAALARRLVREEARRPFDLGRGPLLRTRLVRLSREEHVLVLAMHHIASDGWSMGVLLREVAALYEAFSRGEPSPLAELPVQYADFAVWQRAWLTDDLLERQMAWWRGRLAGAPAVLEIPTDRPRRPLPGARGASVARRLPRGAAEGLRALARGEGATLYMVLLAALDALLARWSEQEDVVVGTPIANRNRVETEGLIGFFVNTLALRTDVSGNPELRELLGRVRETTLGAYQHQDVPFEKLVEELGVERSLSHAPLFQVMFMLDDGGAAPRPFGGMEAEPFGAAGESVKFDLGVAAAERGDGLDVAITYREELWEASTLERVLDAYVLLLEAVVADPGARVLELPLVAGAERERVLREWSRGPAAPPPVGLLHERFACQARRTPDAPAVVHGDTTLTYAGLDARAGTLAAGLRARGVGPEVRVGVCLERGIDAVAALLAVLGSGGVYVPLDPAYPADRLAFMLADSGVRVVLTAGPWFPRLPDFAGEVLFVDGRAAGGALPPAGRAASGHPVSPENLAYVIYTSGSTGTPRGVMVPHGAAARLLSTAVETFGARPGSRVVQTASLSFDASILEVFLALLSGAALHVADRDTVLSGDALGALLREREIDLWVSTPPLLELLAEGELPALRAVGTGGERCPGELAARWSRGRRLMNMYGPTETTIYTTWHPCRPGAAEAPPIGRPVAGTRAYVLDGSLQPAPAGMPGELYVGGGGVARGYLGRPELTAEKFVPDPFSPAPGARLYRTGDRVRWRADGELEFLGRVDAQVKIRGIRIEPGEVEAALLAHPGVRAAAAAVREDTPGRRMLVAYAVAEEGVTGAELREAAKRRLPEYMVPAAVVLLDALPLSATGKVDRGSLPAPEPEEARGPVAPRTPTEEVVAGIWATVLGVPRVGRDANFFELGGHSLLATRVASRVGDAFGVDLPLRAIFEAPTVAELSARIAAQRSEGGGIPFPPLVPVSREGPLPLSFAQQRLWFIHRLDPGSGAYNVPLALRLRGALDARVLERTIAETVRRHEALRTVFEEVGGEPVQVVRPAGAAPLPAVDLSGLPEGAREARARRLVRDEVRRPFDLRRGPLLRTRLLRLSREEHVLVLAMHHVVSDGWSMGVLFREVAALYGAFARGEPSPLPELPVQYADFAAWQRAWLAGEALDGQAGWWKERLAGAPPLLEVPTDRPRAVGQSDAAASHAFTLSAETSAGLRALARREGATLFMTALAGWQALLGRWSGQDDVVVGTPIAGRTRTELEGLIGFFVNMLPLRADLGGGATWRELLGRVREGALGAYAHQDLPFERLVEELATERSLTHTPVFQVTFALQEGASAREGSALGEVALEAFGMGTAAAQFDLDLTVVDEGDSLRGVVTYRTALFEAATVARTAGHLESLLEAMSADPARRLSELSLLRGDERARVLHAWNATAQDFPRDLCLHELVAAQARRTPDAPAVLFGGRALAYAELDAGADRLARLLRRRGVGPETRVAVSVEKGPEMVLAVLGVLKAGGAYVPLDPAYPAERLACVLADSGAALLLTQTHLAARFAGAGAPALALDALGAELAAGPAGAPESGATPENLAYVIYTSGSTGTPRGVGVAHRSLANYAHAALGLFGLVPQDRVLQFASLSFDTSAEEIFCTLLAGAALVPRTDEMLGSAARFFERCEEWGVTVLDLPTAYWHELAAALGRGETRLPGCVRLVVVGGERMLPEAVAEWRRRVGAAVELVDSYGPTEATIAATTARVGEGTLSIGGPVANVRAYVLEPTLEPAPVGLPGELWIGGAGVARGYLGRPELTAERFVPDPFSGEPGARLYRTGDRARWLAGGTVEFLGRMDAQVKLRGFRIEPGEIEAALRRHPRVREAVVTVREDTPGERRLVAYVVPAPAPGRGHPELWPSVGEYPVYDELLYGAMVSDERRNAAYREALRGRVAGRTAVDVGTGSEVLLARMCVEAGARRVYAVEVMEESFRRARERVRELGLEDRITVLHGDAATLELPEAVDVCVSELIGSIGGSEGAAAILDHARHWLKPGGAMVPRRCETWIAAATLPDELHADPAFGELAARYAERVMEAVGHREDLRLCVKGFPADALLSDAGVFEELDFTRPIGPPRPRRLELRIGRDGRLDGFVLWIRLYVGERLAVDSLEHEGNWLPVFFPAFYPGLEVREGESLALECSASLPEDGLHPDYHLRGVLRRLDGREAAVAFDSFHRRPPAAPGALHRRLVSADGVRMRPAAEARPLAAELRARLRERLPEHMVPGAFVLLDALPLNVSGKVDRRALPAPEWGAEGEHVAPRTATEEVLAGIWAEVLELERVGAHDNFFERGGHSLLATRVVSRVAASLGAELPLRALFEAQTIAELAARVDAARRAGEGAAPPPLVAVDRGGPLPLSFAQERLWFLHQLDPQGAGYHMPVPSRVAGPLDAGALQRALGALVRRHESLRTTFRPVDGGAVQVVCAAPAAPARVPLADLSGLAPEAREREARRLAEEDAERPFDLRHGPLLRLALLRLRDDEHVMLLCMHHIVSDGWSMGVLYRELYALYAAASRGEAPGLPALAVQYGDFAVWQRGWLAGDVLRRQLDWWRERLDGSPPALELPTDRPRPAVATGRGASLLFRVPADDVRALRAAARREGATLYMVLRAAADVLLARWSGQEDLVVGSPIAGRTRVELEGLIGFFVNTLALRTDLSGDPTFRELVGRVRETALGAYAHQDLPFERLVEEVAPERSLSHTPLFQVMFALQNTRDDAVPAPPGLRIERFRAAMRAARFDLELDLFEEGEELVGGLRFRTDLFDRPTVERFAAQYRTLLASAGAAPGERCSRLRLLPDEETRLLLAYGSGPAHATPAGESVPRLLAARAARTPEAVAVRCGGEALTYAQLDRRAAALARRLRCRGAGAGTTVAVCLERGPQLLVALLAVWKAGGVYLPLDPAHPAERLSFLLGDSGARLVLSEPGPAGSLPEHPAERVLLGSAPDGDAGEPDAEPCGAPGEPAYLIYTSGSTGAPKAVVVEHAQLAHTLRASLPVLGLGAADVVAALASVAFDISLLEMLAPLLAGGAVRIVPREAARDPAELVRACADATVLHAVPALMRQVVEAARGGGLPALRLLLVGGDAVPPDLLEEVREAFPGAAARVLYGPTEAAIICAAYEVPAQGGIAGHPLGHPLPGVRLQVRGPRGELLPVGVPGEVWISGGGVARGYLGRPELTAERFVTRAGERAYRTGDRARWRTDGVLEFLGRTDEQVKVRGFRIEPGEVEAALRGEPGVREAVVLAREDEPGEKRLVAYVVPESAGRAAGGDGAAEQVAGWETVFDETYGEGGAEGDPALDLTGWNSSYTGEPIPREEMREWVERTVERVLALRPRRVLEIGCGTGLLLFRLAPHVREYLGTDFSAVALEKVRRHLAALPHVGLAEHEADDLAGYAGGGYDAVVINSVAQYFPGVDYLLRVLEGAAAALGPGGRIFVGDVRSLPLLPAFHASVELARAPGELPAGRLRERVRRAMAEEQELVVEPAFFDALRARLPRLGRVEVQVKRGGYDNEVSRFRYDVVLHLDAAPPAGARPAVRSWSGEDAAGVRALFEESAAALLLRGVPDPRVREHARAAELLSGPAADTADGVRAHAAGCAAGVPREALFALGEALGRAVEVRPGAPGTLDVLLHPAGGAAAFPAEPAEERPWESYANDPRWGRRIRALVPALRAALRARLPEYMLPSAFVVMESLPVTPNGKVDRQALPVPDTAGARDQAYAPPRSALEEALVGIWQEVLGVERVGIHDSFFDLGGHSLLATQLVARIGILRVEVPVRQLFQTPTVAGLAESVTRAETTPGATEVIASVLLRLKTMSPGERAAALRAKQTPVGA